MKIIIYAGVLNPPVFVKLLAKHLAKRKHKVYLMGDSNKVLPWKSQGVRYLPVSGIREKRKLWLQVLWMKWCLLIRPRKLFRLLSRDLREIIKSGKPGIRFWLFDFVRSGYVELIRPDVIHNQWSPALPLFRHLTGKFCIVQSFHGIEQVKVLYLPRIKDIYTEYFHRLNAFQVVTRDLKQTAVNYGVKEQRVKVIRNFIEAKLLDKPVRYWDGKSPLKIISVGRVHWQKGYEYALDAMHLLKNKGLDFHYTLIADGNTEGYHFQVHDLHLEERVTIIGGSPHERVLEEIAGNDLFLLPSVHEGLATVVVEAMALGTPVITTDCGGMKGIVTHDRTGWIVPSRDVDALVNAIKRFSNLTTHKIQDVGENAKDLIRKDYVWEKEIRQFEEFYFQAVKDFKDTYA